MPTDDKLRLFALGMASSSLRLFARGVSVGVGRWESQKDASSSFWLL